MSRYWPGSKVEENTDKLPEDFDFSIWGPGGGQPSDEDSPTEGAEKPEDEAQS